MTKKTKKINNMYIYITNEHKTPGHDLFDGRENLDVRCVEFKWNWELPNLKTNQTVKQTQTWSYKNTSSDKTRVYTKHRSQLAHCTIPFIFTM